MVSHVAVIPARGGSKRIPRKNLVEFGGRPMLAWTVEAALETGQFDRVLVSTDEPEIARVAEDCGASAPFLRDAHADDHATVSEATIRALNQLETHANERHGVVVQLMPNCPLRRAGHIQAALDRFHAGTADFQLSCCAFGWLNPWWAVRLDAESRPEPLFPEAHLKRSQDLERLYCLTGTIWIARVPALLEAGSFKGPGHAYHPLPWRASIDIDDADDLDMARALLAAGRRSA